MSKENEMYLSLDGETFRRMKTDFDGILNRTIGNMQMKGASDATITLKLDISITKGVINIDGVNRDYNKPSFKHQISSVLQIKDKATGQLAGEIVLEWDDDAEKFVVRPVDDGQSSFFDDEYETTDDDTIDVKGLPEPKDKDKEAGQSDEDMNAFDVMMQFTGRNLTIVEKDGVFTVRATDTNDVILSSGCEDGSPFLISPEVAAKHIGEELFCYMFSDDNKHVSGIAIDCTVCNETIFIMKAPDGVSYEIPDDEDIGEDEANDSAGSDDTQDAEFDDDYDYDTPEEDEEE